MAAQATGTLAPSKGIGIRLANFYRFFRRWPVIPVSLLALVLFCGIAAPWISPTTRKRES